jgi:hypothetical protein
MLSNGASTPDNDDFDLAAILELTEENEYGLDPTVFGIPSLLMGQVKPKPYPINIYNLDGRKESGLAGTLYPSGEFKALPTRNIPRGGEHFDEGLKMKVPNTIIWDGSVVGCVEIPVDPDEPMRRLCDGSITGPWPLNPPKAERLVSVEGARAAAIENERDARSNGGALL